MAEHVQATLDQMVAPLQDLQSRGIFTKEEVRVIVERRRNAEYAMRRRHARQADFLQYIQDEINLEKLRNLRTKRVMKENKEPRSEEQSARIGDKHILQHLHLLWTRTLRKFRSNVSLYLEYANFCKEHNSTQRLARVYAEALQYHPKEVTLWIEAASHEFFVNGSVQNARVLLQRGLRVNPKAQDLWLQSFVLELHFLQKLHGRKRVLEIETTSNTDDEFKIPKLIYDNAIQTIPNVEFRLEFIAQSRLFANTNLLMNHIWKSIEQDCQDDPQSWIARAMWEHEQPKLEQDEEPQAKRRRNSQEPHSSVIDVIKEAVQTLKTEEMYFEALQFLQSYIQEVESEKEIAATRLCMEQLLTEASQAEFYSVRLALERAQYLFYSQDKQAAALCLDDFLMRDDKDKEIWIQRAKYAASQTEAIKILKRALSRIPMDRPDHLNVILELFVAKLEAKDETDLSDLFQQIILLAPAQYAAFHDPVFGIDRVGHACIEYLKYLRDNQGHDQARQLYQNVLFKSTVMESGVIDSETVRVFFNECIQMEIAQKDKKQLERLYDRAIRIFSKQDDKVAYEYRQDLEELRFGQLPSVSPQHKLPSFNATDTNFSLQQVMEAFERHRVVHIRNLPNQPEHTSWQELPNVYKNLNEQDQSSWCIETPGAPKWSAAEFFSSSHRGYASFLIQHDPEWFSRVESQLPIRALVDDWTHASALWIFFGYNPVGSSPLVGRPEHTDAVSHDGTWHYQWSGVKQWNIRPTPQLLAFWTDHNIKDTCAAKCTIECRQGDVLLIDTKMWFHQTVLPPDSDPSVSYARDVWVDRANDNKCGMTNLDGLYATNDIEEGTIIFRESELPDVELHTAPSEQANCAVVDLDDGSQAVVSTRAIASGEFFTVAEDDDSEGVDDDDDDDEYDEE